MDERAQAAPGAPAPIGTRTLTTVWLALFLDLVGFGIVLPVLPFYASHHGASPLEVALLSTTFSFAQLIMAPILGRVSDRHGRRPVMLISIAGSAAAMFTLAFAETLVMVFFARLVSGLCNSNISTANAYVADHVAPEQRARYMGMMGSAIGLGFICGPIMGGLLSIPTLPTLPFLVAGGLAIVNWIMAFSWLPEARVRPISAARPLFFLRAAMFRHLRATGLLPLVVLNFCFYFAFANMESTFALFTEARFGWTARETGYFFTYIGATVALTQGVLVGRVVGRLGERRTLIAGLLTLGGGLLVASLAPIPALVYVGALGISCGNGLTSSSLNALVSRHSGAEEQGLNLGLAASAASLARMTGPAIGGLVFQQLGVGVPMQLGAIVVVLAAMIARARLPRPAGA